jgi:hypothetical protein
MSAWLALKIRDSKTGLYSAPGIIGQRWTKTGRSWSGKGPLGASIRVLEERQRQRWFHLHGNPDDWQVVALTVAGEVVWKYADWAAAVGTGKTPVPVNNPLIFTDDEIEQVEEACRNHIGDADEAGELSMRVVEALKHFTFEHIGL